MNFNKFLQEYEFCAYTYLTVELDINLFISADDGDDLPILIGAIAGGVGGALLLAVLLIVITLVSSCGIVGGGTSSSSTECSSSPSYYPR